MNYYKITLKAIGFRDFIVEAPSEEEARKVMQEEMSTLSLTDYEPDTIEEHEIEEADSPDAFEAHLDFIEWAGEEDEDDR